MTIYRRSDLATATDPDPDQDHRIIAEYLMRRATAPEVSPADRLVLRLAEPVEGAPCVEIAEAAAAHSRLMAGASGAGLTTLLLEVVVAAARRSLDAHFGAGAHRRSLVLQDQRVPILCRWSAHAFLICRG
ncbi:MAG: hypothetical protein WKH64_02595 [Chloroflexia bacterium]